MSQAVKPWSRQQRIRTSFKMTLLIGAIAGILGTGLYTAGVALNLITPFSLVSAVSREVAKDQNLVQSFYQSLADTECRNQKLGFKVTYKAPLRLSPGNEYNNCTEFKLTNAEATTSYIKIEHQREDKEQVMSSLLENLVNVETSQSNHLNLEGTFISGYSNELYLNAIVMAASEQQSVVFLLYPADATGVNAFKALAASYQRF